MRSHSFLRSLPAVLIVGCFLTGSPRVATSGPFEDGVAAHAIGNHKEAAELWRPLADAGEARAQFNLGISDQRGEGVPQDLEKAMGWYRKAAERIRVTRAQYNLALMYHRGEGVPQNYGEAAQWYREAAEGGGVVRPRICPLSSVAESETGGNQASQRNRRQDDARTG